MNFIFLVSIVSINVRLSCGLTQFEFDALVDFYHSLNGNNWYDNSGWEFAQPDSSLEPSDICGTYYPRPFGINCSDTHHVTEITIDNNNLVGTIPESIGNLTVLWGFLIGDSLSLTGTIPETMYDLVAIKYFGLLGTNVTGTISDSIGKWQYLLSLMLVRNNMDININFNNNLCKLTTLQVIELLDNTNMYGTIPQCIEQLTSLQQLEIGNLFTDKSYPNINGMCHPCTLFVFFF